MKTEELKYKNMLNKMRSMLCHIVSTACIFNCIFLMVLTIIPELSHEESINIMLSSLLSGVFGGIFWLLSL